ncbi:MAG: hypothetical protein FJX76_01355 [Armatimonadetes bacterium]|nr:hypothetical protein [Armatimonadota bacterium]
MSLLQDPKTGAFYEIPEAEAKKYLVPAENVREAINKAGLPGAGPGPQPGGNQPGTITLHLNVAELLAAQGAGQQVPVGAGGPRVSAQWWVPGHYNGLGPHPGWGYYHPAYWHPPGVYIGL